MPLREKKVVAVLPAYNAEKTLKATLDDIPKDWVDEILLVDDCSRDRTVELSRELGIRTVVHKRNRGYGGNQKAGYRRAIELLEARRTPVERMHTHDFALRDAELAIRTLARQVPGDESIHSCLLPWGPP